MERYQRLFQLPDNLYVTGSPVVIAAGALTKDTQTDRVFIQIKAKSIVEKAIKAIIVELSGYDVSKNKIEETIKHEYLDLDLKFNGEVGSKVPVYLDNSSVRSFSLKNIKVIFADDDSFEADFSSAQAVPAREELGTVYDDDQVFQFKKIFGENCKYMPAALGDLFLCSCGGINRSEKCGLCEQNITDMISVNSQELKNDGIYNEALSEFKKDSAEGCMKAITLFESIIDWKDSSAKIDECNARIEELRIAEEEAEAERKRKVEEARIAAEKKKALYKKIAVIGGPIVAGLIIIFIVLNAIILPSANYNKAVKLANAEKNKEAIVLFSKLKNFKDSAEKYDELIKLSPTLVVYTIDKGDCFTFGSYEQDEESGDDRIEWQVIDKKDGKLLVISKNVIDCLEFGGGTWSSSSLREWLNDYFYNYAFDSNEKGLILETTVKAETNPEFSTRAGDDTTDRLFLLSINETTELFPTDKDRLALPSLYAEDKNPYGTVYVIEADEYGNRVSPIKPCIWWLRTPGDSVSKISAVVNDGSISYTGGGYAVSYGVRPAMWIDIS